MKSSNIEIGNIDLDFGISVENFDGRLLELFQSVPKFATRCARFCITGFGLGMSILSCFKPGTLRFVILLVQTGNEPGEDVRMLEMEQFKQAETFTFDDIIVFDPIHLQRFFHLIQFTAKFLSINVEDFVIMIKKLSTTGTFEDAKIFWNHPPDISAVGRALGADVNRERGECKYSIADSNFHLLISVETSRGRITREKNN